MKNKLILLKNDGLEAFDQSILQLNSNLINRVTTNATIEAYNPGGGFVTDFLADYPKTNIFNSHIYKEARVNSFDNGIFQGGVSLTLDNTLESFNSLVFQWNKLNTKIVEDLKANNTITVELVKISTGNAEYSITFNFNNTLESFTYNPDFYAPGEDLYEVVTGKINADEAILLIDEDITRYFDKQSFSPADYSINIYLNSLTDFEYFSISNICINDSFHVCMDEKFDFVRNNLNVRADNKRTGIGFKQINSYQKAAKTAIKLMDIEEQMNLDALIKFSKDVPLYVFPFCEDNEESNFKESLLNLEWGGLYDIKNSWKINLQEADIYNTGLDLIEYK